MRIPSDLHRDPLYRKGAKRVTADTSWRRVIRLLIVLGLVLVVMRQAAQPEVYQAFFPEPMLAVAQSGAATGQAISLEAIPLPKQQAIDDAMVEEEAWANKLTPAEASQWIQQFLQTADQNSEPSRLDAKQIARTRLAVQKLIDQTSDGGVWRAVDGPALQSVLALHQIKHPLANAWQQSLPKGFSAGLLPLLQQPEVYRGKRVIAQGKLARIERIKAAENAFAVQHYWHLWLQPEDASGRPWLTIVPDLPAGLKSLTEQTSQPTTMWEATSPLPKVQLVGEFLKRLSYQSTAGVELTPVVVGHVTGIQSNGNPIVEAGLAQGNPQTSQSSRTSAVTSHAWTPWLVIAGTVAVGILFAWWVMWRSSLENRELRARRNRQDEVIVPSSIATTPDDGATSQLVRDDHSPGSASDVGKALLLAMLFGLGSAAQAQPLEGQLIQAQSQRAESLLDRLPGFDLDRMGKIVTQRDAQQVEVVTAEVAKLVFRMRRIETATIRYTSGTETQPQPGDAMSIDGTVATTQSIAIEGELQEYLGMKSISKTSLTSDDGQSIWLFSEPLIREVSAGDILRGTGVLISTGSSDLPSVIVCGRVQWFPQSPLSVGHAMLAKRGIDLGSLASLQALDREPLTAEDTGLFFRMIGVANNVQNEQPELVATARQQPVQPLAIDLLQDPKSLVGQWIRLDVETVRVTRVAIQSPERQREIGDDHYFQIDAIGDLGNVQLKIEVPGGEPVLMENRYPVSVVSANCPDFLRGGDDGLVVTQSVPITVEGFFYRLWSYESELMSAVGGKQFAPLVIAGRIEDRSPKSNDPIGVSFIGKLAASGVLIAMVGILIFSLVTRRGDQRSRQRRRD